MTRKECINDFNLLISLIHFFIDTLFPKYNNKVSFFGLFNVFSPSFTGVSLRSPLPVILHPFGI